MHTILTLINVYPAPVQNIAYSYMYVELLKKQLKTSITICSNSYISITRKNAFRFLESPNLTPIHTGVKCSVCNNTGCSARNWDKTDENDKPHISRLETTSRKRNQKQNESQP